MTKKSINGVISDMTPEEIAQAEQDRANAISERETIEAETQAKADLKASAKAKLISGEALTEDEADTIVL